MKKAYLLAGMILFGIEACVNGAHRLTKKERQNIENVQWDKIERQRELARPDVYKMLDAVIEEDVDCEFDGRTRRGVRVETLTIDWPTIFNLLDLMRGVISVNEYRTPDLAYPLIYIAIKEGNALIVKVLLEKYKADPNVEFLQVSSEPGAGCQEMTPLKYARKLGDKAIVNLLIKYGATR